MARFLLDASPGTAEGVFGSLAFSLILISSGFPRQIMPLTFKKKVYFDIERFQSPHPTTREELDELDYSLKKGVELLDEADSFDLQGEDRALIQQLLDVLYISHRHRELPLDAFEKYGHNRVEEPRYNPFLLSLLTWSVGGFDVH
jgi:hypothetical protein